MLLLVFSVSLAGDEVHYAYDAWRTRTQLFTVEGLRWDCFGTCRR